MLKSSLMASILLSCALVYGNHFPQFRGPNGVGVAEMTPLPTSWSATENLAWKVQIPGAGWSQPVLIGNRLFLTTAVSDKNLKPKDFSEGVKLPQSMGLGGLTPAPDTVIRWEVFCLDAATGGKLWSKTIKEGKPKHPIHPSNTYATESPVADENGVYVFFGATGTIAGLDHQGSELWRHELGAFATSSGFGTGSSLAIHNGKVFVQHFTNGSALLVCYDTKSGKEIWRAERARKESSWSSPVIWQNDKRVELLSSGNDLICSYDPETGKELWRLGNIKAPTACSIAADRKQIYFGASDPFSTGPLFAMKAGAEGNISPKKKNGEFQSRAWEEAKGGPGMSSPVSSGAFVYVVDNNILKCYEAATGKRVYQNRLSSSALVAACPIVVGETLLILDEAGTGTLVKVGPKFETVGGGKLDDVFWATPAIGNGAIYFRGVDGLYCIRK
ncbi:MAG: PQQ-binding-like beta-propeller repeat protein [Planctomycetales bacterium]